MRALSLALLLAATPALAEVPLSAAEFEAYATGKTLTYAIGGTVYGTEQYLPGRKVRWAFEDGDCQTGHWYEEDGWICFAYEDTPDPQCWTFFRGETGIRARFLGDAEGSELSEVGNSSAPLACAGPDIGA